MRKGYEEIRPQVFPRQIYKIPKVEYAILEIDPPVLQRVP